VGYQEKTHAMIVSQIMARLEVPELPALALPRSGRRVCGVLAALSALCAPLSDVQLSAQCTRSAQLPLGNTPE